MGFPCRLNLIYGERWALACEPRSSDAVCGVPLEEVLQGNNFRKDSDYRWFFDDIASNGVLIRSDHLLGKGLREGSRVSVERSRKASQKQRWQLVYSPDPSPQPLFHLLSASSGLFLSVNAVTGVPKLQRGAPELLWRMHDATGKARQALGRLATGGLGGKVHPADNPVVGCPPRVHQVKCPHPFARASTFLQALEQRSVEALSLFDGDLAAAWRGLPALGDGFLGAFTPPEELWRGCLPLVRGVELTGPGPRVSIDRLFTALFSKRSDFMSRYNIRRGCKNVESWPSKPVQDQPWLHTDRGQCLAHLPILGLKRCREMNRWAFCREGGRRTLALQHVSSMEAGPLGEVRVEVLYLFTQHPEGSGPLLIEGIAQAPTGKFKKLVADGLREASETFISVASEVLSWPGAPAGVLRKAATLPVEGPARAADASPQLPRAALCRSQTAPVAGAPGARQPLPPAEGCCTGGIARLLGW